MKTTIEKQPENIVKVDIEVPAKDAVNYYNNAAKRLAQYVNIPGFRKGKAPRNIVEQNIGEERIKHEALEGALPKIFSEVIKENDFDVVAQPYVESYDYKIGEDLRIVAKLELRPEVTLGEYKGLTIEVEEYKTPEDALQKSIDSLLEQHATTVVVTDRKTLNTDTIVFDFEGFSNGEKIEHGDAKNYTLDLAHSSFIPGFAEQLADRTLGEEFEINVTFPEEYHAENLAGKDAVFKVKVKEIKKRELPELDDDFASEVSEFDTMDEFRADVRKKLEEAAENKAKVETENAVIDKVIENAEFDLPDAMVETQIDNSVRDFAQRLSYQGMNLDMYMQYTGMTMDALRAQFAEQAKKQLSGSLVLEAIQKAEGIEAGPEEVELELVDMSKKYNMELDKLKELLGDAEKESIKKDLEIQKTITMIVNNAQVK